MGIKPSLFHNYNSDDTRIRVFIDENYIGKSYPKWQINYINLGKCKIAYALDKIKVPEIIGQVEDEKIKNNSLYAKSVDDILKIKVLSQLSKKLHK